MKAADDIKNHADSLTAVIDTNHESTIEKVEKVKDALALAGITDDMCGPTIGESFASLSASIKGTSVPKQEPQSASAPVPIQHSGPCTWQSSGAQPNTLICVKGCGSQMGISAPTGQILGPRVQISPPGPTIQYQQPANQTGVQYDPSVHGYAHASYQATFNKNNNNNNSMKRKRNFSNAGVRVQTKQHRPNEVSTQQYVGVPVAYPGGGNGQYVGYQQQQQVLPHHPGQGAGMTHAQVFHGGHSQPVMGAPLMGVSSNPGQPGPH